ncbi:GNAT family N-acetyltransferase [Streptomyces sp. NPDC004111]|uniref:GNAT family N-acetyltransferase n=1 Tax=Streptomyces sp. NPDC004111 TaxID=3364690 RepID=UPI00367EBF72
MTQTGSGTARKLRLAEITAENIDAALSLEVRPEQAHLVAPVVKSLAEAYAFREQAWPRLVLDGERPVAFLMGFFDIDFADGEGTTDLRSGLWRLNVAAGEQGRGYGRFAVGAVADEIRRRGGTRLVTSWEPGEGGPEGFYLALGFRLTGDESEGEVVGELDLEQFARSGR